MKYLVVAVVMVALVGLILPAAQADDASMAAQAAVAAMHESLVNQNGEPTAELQKLVISSENAASAESNTLMLLEMVSLLSARVAPGADTSADGVTTVTITPRPIKFVMVRDGDAWKVDLRATMAALPEATRQAVEKMGTEQQTPAVSPPATGGATATVGEVNDNTFSDQVLKTPGWVMVDFSASWCEPCQQLAPVLKAMAPEYAGKLRFLSLDIDKSPKTNNANHVDGWPTLIIFHNGQVVGRWDEGYAEADRLKPWIDGVLKGTAAPTGDR